MEIPREFCPDPDFKTYHEKHEKEIRSYQEKKGALLSISSGGNLEEILVALPRDRCVAACLRFLEGWKLTEEESIYMMHIAKFKTGPNRKPRTEGEHNDCYYAESCDSQEGRDKAKAWMNKVRETIKSLLAE